MCAYNKLTYNIFIGLSLGVYQIIFYAARLLVMYINELNAKLLDLQRTYNNFAFII